MQKTTQGQHAQRALLALAAAVLLAMAPWFTTAALVAPLRQAWHLSGGDAAWLTIAAQLGFVGGALAVALSNVADRVAPRWLILSGGLAAAAANAAVALCHSFGAAWPWRFVTGACLALVYPPALKLMASWFRAQRGMALGVMVGALTVGAALPHLAAALGGADWRAVVWITSAITAAITFGVIAVGGVGCWWGGVLSDRGGRERAAATAMAISGTCALTLGWLGGSSPWALAAVIAVAGVWGFWVVADSAQFSALVTELADPQYVGTALTLQLGLGFTLACITIGILPWLQVRLGWAGAFLALVPGPALGMAAMIRLQRWRARLAPSERGGYAAKIR